MVAAFVGFCVIAGTDVFPASAGCLGTALALGQPTAGGRSLRRGRRMAGRGDAEMAKWELDLEQVLDTFLTVPEIAQILRIGKNQAYRLVHEEIPFVRIGPSIRVSRYHFQQWLNQHAKH